LPLHNSPGWCSRLLLLLLLPLHVLLSHLLYHFIPQQLLQLLVPLQQTQLPRALSTAATAATAGLLLVTFAVFISASLSQECAWTY
jgi:hypothetical protein